MRFTLVSFSLLALTSALALPGSAAPASDVVLQTRQNAPVKPPPCVRNPHTTEKETYKRHEAFVHAFLYEKDISEAFRYIAKDYIVCGLLLPSPTLTDNLNRTTTHWRKMAPIQHGVF